MKEVCVIGGSRYFGRHLVAGLRDRGVDVTLVNRGSQAPPPGVTHVVADRDDERGLARALGTRTFDVVVDQVCNTPLQAAVAARVFAGRTGRYVMTSTIEVYDHSPAGGVPAAAPGTPMAETAVDPELWPVDPGLPWHDRAFLENQYGEGKRQAEAVFTREAAFPFVTVRSGHVMGGGPADFTGRLRHYVERIRAGRPIVVHRDNHPSSFVHHREIAEFLRWTAGADFTGAVNARSHGEFDVFELCDRIASHTAARPVYDRSGGAEVSPYSFGHYYGMDNSRAGRLGFAFSHTRDWLPDAVAQAL
ncbi:MULTISPECIES: NAD-dependent epimerase/dehydratase family protein [Streptosporangium]|uniref:Nucleoside-diphosphate-sugar epimerase n=1 Tax=Streptosporangium brasiliense TaxID=47480 RepID=A0ABT9R724_9ACTN|nr:NAD-dependent epimerase/dehydratase family protein [Streptosporangium brasiliense]MDP9864200.1 nucleoside-diphosphate-sugar epimerase [Streptosporangium brasiliense]